jgi:hypothetical protein
LPRLDALEDRAERRAPKLLAIAETLVSEGVLSSSNIILRPTHVPIATAGYFLLNSAYKRWRIQDGHRTEAAKIAALQCMAILSIPPFKVVDRNNATTLAEARCNEIFAVAAASAVLGVSVSGGRSKNFELRLWDILSECISQTLEPYIVDLEMKIDRPLRSYDLSFHKDDRCKINSLITIFELLKA